MTTIDTTALPAHVGLADTVQQTMTMAWRATLKMRRNIEQFFDVTIQPVLFTAMFAGIFGGAISGSVEDYLPILIPGLIAQTVLTARTWTRVSSTGSRCCPSRGSHRSPARWSPT
jgi:ABC-2 type transport system permease protein